MPSENPPPNERGLMLSGFVERVGDPVPLVASDGSSHRGERLVADSLEALIQVARPGRTPELIRAAIPAHWRPGAVDALRAAVASKRTLSPQGKPLPLVSDALAALTALQAQPGLPARGVVALCDFGATGTSITLADAAAGFRNVVPTVRFEDFSGDSIDQAVLRHMLSGLNVDPSSTSAVVGLTRVREQCRAAKERLSSETATGFTVPLPGSQSTLRLTRGELEALIGDQLNGLIAILEETLQRHNVARPQLVAVATVGGGARIPLVTQRLSEALRLPVISASQPQTVAAAGAALLSRRGPEDRPATRDATIAPPIAQRSQPVGKIVLASQSVNDIAPAARRDNGVRHATDRARPNLRFDHSDYSRPDRIPPAPWYRRPGVLAGTGVAAAIAVALGVLGVWWLTKPDDSASPSMSTSSTTTEAEVTSIVADTATAADSTLLGLVSGSFARNACQPVHPPFDGALATVDCDGAWGSRSVAARYWLFAGKDILAAKFEEGIRETTDLEQCPDSGEQSPTTWHYDTTPDKVEGSVMCARDADGPRILWTNDADMLLGNVYGPSNLEDLHNWWLKYG